MSDRLPPQAPEAEMAIVGALLVEAEVVPEIASTLSPEDFYDLRHRKVFSVVSERAARGLPLDFVSVCNALRDLGQIEAVGGHDHLGKCQDLCVSAYNWPMHAGILREKTRLRRLASLCSRTLAGIYEPADPEAFLSDFERQAMAVRGDTPADHDLDAGQMARAMIDRIERREDRPVFPSGLRVVDRKVRMRPGQMVVIGARTSVGKSAFGLGVALHNAVQGRPVGIISVEMTGDEVFQRLASSHSAIPFERWNNPTDDLAEALASSIREIRSCPVRCYYRGGIRIRDVVAVVRRWRQRFGVEVVVVDYLQKILPDGKSSSRYDHVTEVASTLKQLALDHGVLVLALAQLNRQASGDTKPPSLHHLRESGAIEQDADVVALLHTTGVKGEIRTVDLMVEKQRSGELGECALHFHGPTMTFHSPPQIAYEDIPLGFR